MIEIINRNWPLNVGRTRHEAMQLICMLICMLIGMLIGMLICMFIWAPDIIVYIMLMISSFTY